MTKLYYDGDSFSCMLPPGETQTTGHVIADRLGYELEHYGLIGKSPAQTIRSSVRYSFEDVPELPGKQSFPAPFPGARYFIFVF